VDFHVCQKDQDYAKGNRYLLGQMPDDVEEPIDDDEVHEAYFDVNRRLNPTIFMADTISVTEYMARHELQHCNIDPTSQLSPLPGTRLNANIIHIKLNEVVTEAQARAVTSPFNPMGPRKSKFFKFFNLKELLNLWVHYFRDFSYIKALISNVLGCI